ncbi:MAG: [FeFe] hydrogenase H-cluster radical SAM maturase HydE [bacterium]|nr:[FeFe] hydrogenase H-cluster radical SAM maturase HydE [bacterium]
MRLLERLASEHTLELEGYRKLIESRTPALAARAAELALACRREVYGNDVFVRGLIEISNHCKNDCLYCGIRASNGALERYRLSAEQILRCCDAGYELGFRTFVMQGGEDAFFTDGFLCGIIERIKEGHPDCAVTLSLGERGFESFKRLREAGAERYLLRHETADRAHYESLHPSNMSFDNRIASLGYLRELGYQVGAGFMVGSPMQTSSTLAADLKLIERFAPEMCGIGPFIPHHETQFRDHPRGTLELTCFLLSLIRLACPDVLLPATTALATIAPDGRERGMLAGANVVMPNLSPEDVRAKYDLYDGKVSSGAEAADNLADLRDRMASIGFNIVVDRGDCRRSEWEAQR